MKYLCCFILDRGSAKYWPLEVTPIILCLFPEFCLYFEARILSGNVGASKRGPS